MTEPEIVKQIADPALVFWTVLVDKLPEILTATGILLVAIQNMMNRRHQKEDLIVAAKKVEDKVDENTAITERAAEKVAAKAEETAAKVAGALEVRKQDLDQQLGTITTEQVKQGVVQDKTHTLVNSNMGISLAVGAKALRRVANLTKDPQDIVVAEEAERLLHEHEVKQAKVDAKERS